MRKDGSISLNERRYSSGITYNTEEYLANFLMWTPFGDSLFQFLRKFCVDIIKYFHPFAKIQNSELKTQSKYESACVMCGVYYVLW
jgi:hypothetical protein